MFSYAHPAIALLLLLCGGIDLADSFCSPPLTSSSLRSSTRLAVQAAQGGFAPVKEKPVENQSDGAGTSTDGESSSSSSSIDPDVMSPQEVKSALVDLIPRLTGDPEEYRAIESYVNALEGGYAPVQTIGFLNLAVGGEWRLLFSTNLMSPSRTLRLLDLSQTITPDGFNGTVANEVQFAYDEEGGGNFDVFGRFVVNFAYSINQGARMVAELKGHSILPDVGSRIPADVPKLFGSLARAMPREVFDPDEHALDTTYMDADLRIVRYTGPKHEGVRNVYVRSGSLQFDPAQ